MRNNAGHLRHIARAGLIVAVACIASPVYSAGSDTFSVFDSARLNRWVHGRKSAVDLSAGPLRLGDASAFFGVDSLSNHVNHYLTSGLQFSGGGTAGRPLIAIGAMHTMARGASFASQTLMRAETQLALGERWYLPDLTLETDQLSSNNQHGAGLNGRATHFGFRGEFGTAAYHVAYFRADQEYRPWGGALAAGDSGVEVTGRYNLGRRWRFRNTLRIHDGSIRTGLRHGLVEKWQLSGVNSSTDIGQPWRVSAQLGAAGRGAGVARAPLTLELASRTRHWRDWHIDSALGWYQGNIATPGALPVRGGLWRISASHYIDLAGLKTRLRPTFSIGGSRHIRQALGSRAGLTVGFPGLLDHVALSVDYLSAGWAPAADRSDMRLSLKISQNAGAVLPRLGSMVDRLRKGWFRR